MANVVSFSIVVVLGSLIRLLHKPQAIQIGFSVDTSHSIHETDEKFLSVAIDSGLIKKKWKNFHFNSKKLANLAKGLSPAYLRIGGTEADYLIFNPDVQAESQRRIDYDSQVNFDWYNDDNHPRPSDNFTLSGSDWERINVFRNEVQWHLLFDVNVLLRKRKKWNPSNAKELIEFSARRGYQIDWQLGNEPIHYKTKGIGGTRLARDFIAFRKVLDNVPLYRTSPLVGPDISHPRNSTLALLEKFLDKASKALGAVSFHHYYLNGRKATLEQFIDPYYYDLFKIQVREVRKVAHEKKPGIKLWLTETSSAYGGGAPGLSNSYVAGFMWLDKLGMSAKEKLDIVVRQTFFHGNYALIDEDLNPLPDYWLSLLYKMLVGRKVFKVVNLSSSEPGRNKIRVYAHCTRIGPIYKHPGAITLYVVNLYNHTVELKVSDDELSSTHINQYLLTPPANESLTSKKVWLNGEELKLTEEDELPKFTATIIDTGKSFKMPPLSFGFYVWPRANIASCKSIP